MSAADQGRLNLTAISCLPDDEAHK